MDKITRTNVGSLSLPGILFESNWFLGYSHQTYSKNKTGKDITYICTPWRIEEIEWAKEKGAKICMPHTSVTDTYVNKREKNLKGIEVWLKNIREYEMIPRLSTHVPETVIYVDNTNLVKKFKEIKRRENENN